MDGEVLTWTANHTGGVVELVQAQLGDLVQVQGPLNELIGRDGVLQSLAVDEWLAGGRGRNGGLLRVAVEQWLLESRGRRALQESGRECSQAQALEARHVVA